MKTKGDQQLVKRINRSVLLRLVRAQPGLSRARLAQESGLTKSTVSLLVRELLDDGWLSESGAPVAGDGMGRPSTPLVINAGLRALIGIEIAVQVVRVAAVSLQGDLLAWAEQFLEESVSPLGRTMLRDMAAASGNEQCPCACVEILRGQLAQIGERAARRGEAMPAADSLIDALAAPIVYRVLFDQPPSLEQVQARVLGLLEG